MHSAKEVAFEKLQAAQFNAYDILRNAADRRMPGVEGAGSLHGDRLWGCGAVRTTELDTKRGQWTSQQRLIVANYSRQYAERKMCFVYSRNA